MTYSQTIAKGVSLATKTRHQVVRQRRRAAFMGRVKAVAIGVYLFASYVFASSIANF